MISKTSSHSRCCWVGPTEASMGINFLTKKEKLERLRDWLAARRRFVVSGPGSPDPEIFVLTDSLNRLPGICTAQSCAGHISKDGYITPGHIWLRPSRQTYEAFCHHPDLLVKHDVIEQASVLFGREVGPVIEIIFHGCERNQLEASADLLVCFFREIAAW